MKRMLVKKHNNLVEGKYNMNIWETRVFIKMVSMIDRKDKDFHEYTIDLNEFVKYFGLEGNKNAYQELRNGARQLQKKIITLKTVLEDGTTEFSDIPILIKVARNEDKKSYVRLSFHPDMKPYLLELKSHFLSYDIKNILQLPTPFSIRIYEICKQYAKIKKRIIAIEELKIMLGIVDKYKKYSNLKMRVIEPSLEYINKYTDIQLSYKELKKGRSVEKLSFEIVSKELKKVDKNERDEIYEIIEDWGVKPKLLERWRKKYDDAYIIERVVYTKKQPDIANRGGYLNSIIDKEIKKEESMSFEEQLKKTRGILYSNSQLEPRIRAKYGDNVGDKALVRIIKQMYPNKFT